MITDFKNALLAGIERGKVESYISEASWFPCGFAYLVYPCRKNAKESKVLIDMGFRWNNYDKAYQSALYHSIPAIAGMSQSMDYRERILRAVCNELHNAGFTKAYVTTRID